MLLALKFRGDLLGPSLSEHCHAHAALNVFARGPEWASLAQELGGEKLNVFQRDDRGTGPEPLGGALLLIDRRWPQVQEAQIGALFVLAASGVILLLAKNPHGGAHLRDLLAGQILWMRYAQLAIPLVATVAGPAMDLARASAAAGLLPCVRAGRHGLGATGGRLPRVRRAHRAEPRCTRLSAATQDGDRLCDRGTRLCARADVVGGARSAFRCTDHLVPAAPSIGAQAVAQRCLRHAGTPVSNK